VVDGGCSKGTQVQLISPEYYWGGFVMSCIWAGMVRLC